jgi:hypothetical protein
LEEIKMQKTTALLLAGLVLASLFGAYTVFSTPAPVKGGGDVTVAGVAPPQPAKAGGCGCGGGFIASGTKESGSSLANATAPQTGGAAQDIYIRALDTGVYDNMAITVKKSIPVRLHFTADTDAGCGRQLVIYGLNVQAVSQNGEEDVVEFTPQDAGTYEYSCGMHMWGPGKLVVTS